MAVTYSRLTWQDLNPVYPVSAERMEHHEDAFDALVVGINQEIIDRQNAITSEATARADADTALDTRLDTLEGHNIDARLDALEAGSGGSSSLKWWRSTADMTDTAVTFDTVTGLSGIALDANSTYLVELIGIASLSITAAQAQWRFVATTATITGRLVARFPAGGNPGVDGSYEQHDTITATLGATPGSVDAANVDLLYHVIGRFTTGGTAGTLAVQGRISTATGAGTATFRAGSTLGLRKVTYQN